MLTTTQESVVFGTATRLLDTVRAEYLEMPGLCLTMRQRVCGVSTQTRAGSCSTRSSGFGSCKELETAPTCAVTRCDLSRIGSYSRLPTTTVKSRCSHRSTVRPVEREHNARPGRQCLSGQVCHVDPDSVSHGCPCRVSCASHRRSSESASARAFPPAAAGPAASCEACD